MPASIIPYPMTRKWNGRIISDYRIVLTFNSFNLSSSSRCSADYVSVYDGMHETSERIGKFCGSTKPNTITSNHSEMFVKFVANGKAQYRLASERHIQGKVKDLEFVKCDAFSGLVSLPKLEGMRDAVRHMALLTAVSLKYCLVSFFNLSAPDHNTPLPPSLSYPSILYIPSTCLFVCLLLLLLFRSHRSHSQDCWVCCRRAVSVSCFS